VRESGLLNVVAKALRFLNVEQYETAVITALVNDRDVLASVQAQFADVIKEMKS
jgi:hypothetical protein